MRQFTQMWEEIQGRMDSKSSMARLRFKKYFAQCSLRRSLSIQATIHFRSQQGEDTLSEVGFSDLKNVIHYAIVVDEASDARNN